MHKYVTFTAQSVAFDDICDLQQEKQKRKAAAIKRAKNGKDKSKAKDGEEIDKDLIRE